MVFSGVGNNSATSGFGLVSEENTGRDDSYRVIGRAEFESEFGSLSKSRPTRPLDRRLSATRGATDRGGLLLVLVLGAIARFW